MHNMDDIFMINSPNNGNAPIKTEVKTQQSRTNFNFHQRKGSDTQNSTSCTFNFHSPKVSQDFTSKKDSIYEESGHISGGLNSMLADNFEMKRRKHRFSLNIVSRLDIDDKKKMPKLAPITIMRDQPSDSNAKVKTPLAVHKYSQGKELPDYKQYSGPFNIKHIPEDGVQIEIDESELDIIDRIDNIDRFEEDASKSKMTCFTQVKHNIVKNESDYYNQYKNIDSILDAEKFFDGNKVSNYSQMLEKTQKNKLFPKKLGMLKSYYSSQFSSITSSRRGSDIAQNQQKQNNPKAQISQRLLTQQTKQPQSLHNSPVSRKRTSVFKENKNQSSNIPKAVVSPKASLTQINTFTATNIPIGSYEQRQTPQSQKLISFPENQNIIYSNGEENTSKNTSHQDINFKSSKFRKDNSNKPNKNNDNNINQYVVEKENMKQDLLGEQQSPIIRQMKANIPFFMKVKSKQGEGKGVGQRSAISKQQMNQKVIISQESSEKLIPLHMQNNLNLMNFNSVKGESTSPLIDQDKRRKIKTEMPEQEEDDDMLNLNHFSINDKYANIVSAGVNESKRFKVIKLGNNRITNKGLSCIVLSMPCNIKIIDISYNCFTHLGLEPFIEKISNLGFSSLTEINLEGNNLGDKSIARLLVVLTDYSKLKKLNISKNSLSAACTPQLSNFLMQNTSIQEIYLRWNKLKGDSGYKIAEALMESISLRVVDISFNSLGIGNTKGENSSNKTDKQSCSKAFAKLIAKDYKSDIIHLDLSYNQFNYEATTIISSALSKNFSILGFHFNGNAGQMDQYGFLHPSNDIPDLLSPLETTIQGVKKIDNSNKKIDASHEHCWICQGWEERRFVWRPLISGNVQDDPIFVLISTEGFRPRKMVKEVNGNLVSFIYRGMFPPNQKIYYFFIAHGNCMIAKEQSHEDANLSNVSIVYSDETVIIPLIQTLNTFTTSKFNQIIDEETYECKISQFPRKEQPLYPKPQQKELKFIWNQSMSVFNEYQNEFDEQLIDQCFEFDVKNSSIEHFISYDFLSFKKTLRTYYKNIKDVFKYYSSLKPFLGEKWTIPIEVFIQMLNSGPIDIVDEKNLKKCSIAIIFDELNYNEKKQNNTPPKQLARHNFLLALLKIAEIKYMHTGQAIDHKRAVELLFEKGFQQVCNQVQCEHQWRIDTIWKQDVDLVLQYYKPLINYMFNKYSQKNPHDPQLQLMMQQIMMGNQNQNVNSTASNTFKLMSITEFKIFVYENVKEFSLVTVTDIQKCFNLSIQTQVDQVNKNRHLYMNLIEFYESLTRLANLLIIYPVGYEYLNESTLQNFKDIHLCCKLESMLVKIFNKRKDETKLLSEISVSQSSLFDQRIRQFLYTHQLIPPQLSCHDSFKVNTLQKVSQLQIKQKKASIVLPTPIGYAQSTYQNSNPELGGISSSLGNQMLDTIKNTFVDGKLIRRSHSVFQNYKSIYFQPPLEEQFSVSQLQEQIQSSQTNKL